MAPWGFHVHGAVDGYSRFILWEKLTLDKSPITGFLLLFVNILVLQIFREGVEKYGRPESVRTDKGTESVLICFDQHLVGLELFTGCSVHNVRVERHWRDVNEKVIYHYRR